MTNSTIGPPDKARVSVKHWADKPILRHLFWFLVLPHQARQWAYQQRSDAS